MWPTQSYIPCGRLEGQREIMRIMDKKFEAHLTWSRFETSVFVVKEECYRVASSIDFELYSGRDQDTVYSD